MSRIGLGRTQYLIHRSNDSNPGRAALEIFCRDALLRLNCGSYRGVLPVFLDQQSRNLPTTVVLLHLPLKT